MFGCEYTLSNYDNQEVIISKDKIYSSYFAKASKIIPNRRLVSVALTSPDGWEGSFARELNPSPSLLSAYKSGRITEQEYRNTYEFETLSKLNPYDIAEKLKGKVICCWEKSGSFCHRHIILEWLGDSLGYNIIGGEVQ